MHRCTNGTMQNSTNGRTARVMMYCAVAELIRHKVLFTHVLVFCCGGVQFLFGFCGVWTPTRSTLRSCAPRSWHQQRYRCQQTHGIKIMVRARINPTFCVPIRYSTTEQHQVSELLFKQTTMFMKR